MGLTEIDELLDLEKADMARLQALMPKAKQKKLKDALDQLRRARRARGAASGIAFPGAANVAAAFSTLSVRMSGGGAGGEEDKGVSGRGQSTMMPDASGAKPSSATDGDEELGAAMAATMATKQPPSDPAGLASWVNAQRNAARTQHCS